ncbi:hypothetical protein EST38_g2698 [Candolleomyces aberdarensis]|uniref:Ribosome maturation protein SDO1/SBDS N-terminal domain-containing protein n=1 Tax=Candolleomyces aberdarensis TaxID=2316362 RepID=A0A4Q2DSU5_9AGAR|nr:hypothetical protein EST38_g2698 [Candolleomyces aberdarensis]
MRSVTKVIYKPDSQSTEEYTVIVDPSEKWKAGDTTIPLTEVVDSFNVYHSAQGSQGLLNTPSNQQLDTVFGTHKDIDVVTKILKDGREQRGELDDNWADTNIKFKGLHYPKTEEVGHAFSEDPGDKEQSALVPANELDEGWMKCLRKWNGKHRRGDITAQQLREALQAYKEKDQRRKRQQ